MPRTKPSRLIGPEDVKPGQFVTIAEVTEQYVCFPDAGPDTTPRVESVTLQPAGAGCPFRVEQVSLPFVLVVAPDGQRYAADLRRHRLARLSRRYGRAAFARDSAPAGASDSSVATTP